MKISISIVIISIIMIFVIHFIIGCKEDQIINPPDEQNDGKRYELPGVATIIFPNDALPSNAEVSILKTIDENTQFELNVASILYDLESYEQYEVRINLGKSDINNSSLVDVYLNVSSETTTPPTLFAQVVFASDDDTLYEFCPFPSEFDPNKKIISAKLSSIVFNQFGTGGKTTEAVLAIGTKQVIPKIEQSKSTRFGKPLFGNLNVKSIVQKGIRWDVPRNKGHNGTDFEAQYIPFQSVESGIIALINRNPTKSPAGQFIIINHGGGYKSRYIHLSEITSGLEEGTEVLRGQTTLGKTGNSGSGSKGPHLHVDFYTGGNDPTDLTAIDILQYLVELKLENAVENININKEKEIVIKPLDENDLTVAVRGGFKWSWNWPNNSTNGKIKVTKETHSNPDWGKAKIKGLAEGQDQIKLELWITYQNYPITHPSALKVADYTMDIEVTDSFSVKRVEIIPSNIHLLKNESKDLSIRAYNKYDKVIPLKNGEVEWSVVGAQILNINNPVDTLVTVTGTGHDTCSIRVKHTESNKSQIAPVFVIDLLGQWNAYATDCGPLPNKVHNCNDPQEPIVTSALLRLDENGNAYAESNYASGNQSTANLTFIGVGWNGNDYLFTTSSPSNTHKVFLNNGRWEVLDEFVVYFYAK